MGIPSIWGGFSNNLIDTIAYPIKYPKFPITPITIFCVKISGSDSNTTSINSPRAIKKGFHAAEGSIF